MTKHELKIWPDYFADVTSGAKRFEIRRNDRNFQAGDEILFKEYNQSSDHFSGRTCVAKIIYVTRGGRDKSPTSDLLCAEACVLGIEVLK